MLEQNKRDRYGLMLRLLILLVTGLLAFGHMPLAAADVSVTRDLPDAVSPGQEFSVSLTQSDFLLNTGIVTETLPEGFRYVVGSLRSDTAEYDEATNNLTLDFEGETTITYLVRAGAAAQIENAAFSGIWKTANMQLDKLSGEVEGDTALTVAVLTPPPSGNGGGNGGGAGGGTTPTSPTPTPDIAPSPSASPGLTGSSGPTTASPTPAPTMGPTESPTSGPTSSPLAEPGIPGFELILALAGLSTVALWLRRGSR